MKRSVHFGTNPIFEWDPVKAAVTINKHGVDFSEAVLVFADPGAMLGDGGIMNGEQRLQILGTVSGLRLLVVIYIEYEIDKIGIIRIISARKAERWERRGYEEQNGALPN